MIWISETSKFSPESLDITNVANGHSDWWSLKHQLNANRDLVVSVLISGANQYCTYIARVNLDIVLDNSSTSFKCETLTINKKAWNEVCTVLMPPNFKTLKIHSQLSYWMVEV